MPRKRRTRQHIIADLSVNHVERHALQCGFSVERIEHDYGTDLILFTYDTHGEIENEQIYIQLKATETLRMLADGQTIAFAVERADLDLWVRQAMPHILIVYAADENKAYWLYVQAYVESLPGLTLQQTGRTVTVHLPKANEVNEAAIRRFAQYKNDVLKQIEGVISHDV